MRIGVLTHYYKSTNYGGNFQAYALVQVLRSNGFDAEQVSYKRGNDFIFESPFRRHTSLYKKIKKKCSLVLHYKAIRQVKIRQKYLCLFNQDVIPHSNVVYTNCSLNELQLHYDTFITGSDQVWHPQAVCDAYLLNFPINGKRIAYAASFSVESLDENVIRYYLPCLKKMNAISVREKQGIELVNNICGYKAEVVLDPTLLLPRKEWEELEEEYPINEPYIFCFFLGSETKHRDIVKSIAQKNQLKIVTLPYLACINKADRLFGEYQLFNVKPGQILSLIKNARCVITDSFHASVFSVLYHKPFHVFDRLANGKNVGMSSRIDTLLSTLHLEQYRVIPSDINNMPQEADWEKVEAILSLERQKSVEFLMNALGEDMSDI